MYGEGDQPQQPMDGSFYLGDAADISDIENLAKQQEASKFFLQRVKKKAKQVDLTTM